MTWFWLALCCALLTACCDAVSKRIVRTNDEWVAGTVLLGVACLLLTPVFLAQDLKPVSLDFILLLAVALPLEVLAYYLFLSAIRSGPLSLTVPLLAFTPVLTILSSALIVGERISSTGAVGIALVTLGAYLLNGDLARGGLLDPLRALVSHAGSRRMLGVAVLWAVTSALGKKGVLMYGAIPFGTVLTYGVLVGFAAISLVRMRGEPKKARFDGRLWGFYLLGGIFMGSAQITHFLAISMAPVAYMLSVKRLSLVFGVLLGWLWFGEGNMRYRLTAAAVMVAGVFFIYDLP
ncbi:MAG: EamA family transporter [Desulfomonile tiedjei]|nr:EamA family transporter [Desulfomonile tiedjei]